MEKRPASPALLAGLLVAATALCPEGRGGESPADRVTSKIIINEIHYHPPNGADADEEFLELCNRTDSAVDLDGWELRDGVRFRFDAGSGPASIPAKGFLVVARNPRGLARITEIEASRIAGPYEGKLSNFSDRLVLTDAAGVEVDVVEYRQDGSWPARADGLGSSLQRVSSEAPGSLVHNWAVYSPRDPTEHRAHWDVTPGRANSVGSAALPPLVTFLERVPREPRSSEPVTIRARVEGSGVERVDLFYDMGSGEKSIPLNDSGRGPDVAAADGIYAAEIPPAPDHSVVRFRIRARSLDGGLFHFPRAGNPSRYAGYYVVDHIRPGNQDLEIYHILWNGSLSCAKGVWRQGCTFVHRGTAYWNVGLKYRGQTSCGKPKSGLKVRFNRGDLFDGQRQLNLLACWQDRSLLREVLAWGLFRDVGHPHCQAKMAAVYANGNRFHGLFVSLEEPGNEYLRRNGLDTSSTLYKCYSSFLGASRSRRQSFPRYTNSEEVLDDSALFEFENKLSSLTGKEHLEYVLRHIDIEALIDYQAVKCLTSDEDGYSKNWLLCQSTGTDAGGKTTHRWTVQPWDLDLSFGQSSLNEDKIHTDKHPLAGTVDHPRHGSHGRRWNGLLEAVFGRRSGDYFIKALYGRIWGLLEEKFHPRVLGETIDRLDANTIAEARADLERWPRWGREPGNPDVHRDRLRDYVSARYRFVRKFLTSENVTTASKVGPWGTTRPPRVAAGTAPPRALAYREFRYTPGPRMKITEIHYNPAEDPELEFIEIRNLETKEVDISGWNLPAVAFTFPAGSVAPAGRAVLVARDPSRLIARHRHLPRRLVFGPYLGRLADRGEDLRLRDSGRYRGKQYFPETIDAVKYRDRPPWPQAADGKGRSLELKDVALDNDLPESWMASQEKGGSPGRFRQ